LMISDRISITAIAVFAEVYFFEYISVVKIVCFYGCLDRHCDVISYTVVIIQHCALLSIFCWLNLAVFVGNK